MLRTEESHQLDPGGSQSLHVAHPLGIHAGLIRDQADPPVADQMQTVGQQDSDPGTDPSLRILSWGLLRVSGACRGAAERPHYDSA